MTRNSIQPLRDQILILRDGEDIVTRSGLLIPGLEDRGHPLRGRVEATGPGAVSKGICTLVDASLGDEVYYVKNNAIRVDDKHSIVGESSLVATVRGDEVLPYWDKVLIELDSGGGSSAAGVVLVSDVGGAFDRGTIVSVGPGFPQKGIRPDMELKAGDRVAFNQFSGVELDLGVDDMRRLFITRESEVYGVWEDEDV